MNFRAFRTSFLSGSVASAALVIFAQSVPAYAQQQTYTFDIPSQELGPALRAFAKTARQQILFDDADVRGKRAKALKGSYTARTALNKLLAGTALSVRQGQSGVFIVRQLTATPASQAVSGPVISEAPTNDSPTGIVSGTVVNRTTGSALAGALVRIQGTDLETVTDDRGQYYFPAVPRGRRVVRVEYLGESVTTVNVSVSAGSRQTANIVLGEITDDIVVFGYRSSIQQALNKQKNADNSATIVSSDLLGGFPAETVSEALRRVPGVAFGRDDATGEGSRILVRGFSSEAIQVQLNGLDLQGSNLDRTIDLSGFLTDNISEIRIQKSLLPSHEASGSGGLIEIETKSGLDYGDFAFNFSVEGETNTIASYGGEYQVNATMAKKITNNFGIVGSIQYRKTDRQNYDVSISDRIPNVLPAGFTAISQINGEENFPFEPEFEDRLIAGSRFSRRNRDEETLTASVNLAWDIADHTQLRLDLQRNMRNSVFEQSQVNASYNTFRRDVFVPELDGEVRRRNTYDSWRPTNTLRNTDQRLNSNIISFRGETVLDRLQLDYKLGYSGSRTKTDNTVIFLEGDIIRSGDLDIIINPATAVINTQDNAAMTPKYVDGGFVTLSNGLIIPSLTEAGYDSLINAEKYVVRSANRSFSNSPTDAYIGEFTATYEPDIGVIDYLKVGGKYNLSIRKAADDRPTSSIGNLKKSQEYKRIFGRNTPLSDIGISLFDTGSLSDIGADDLIVSFLPGSSVEDIFSGLDRFLVDDPNTGVNEERFRFRDFTELNPFLESLGLKPAKSKEERIAAFFETKINFGDFDAVGGVRMEQVTRTGTTIVTPSIRTDNDFQEPRITFFDQGLIDFNDLAGTQRTWTPSILVNYRPTDNIVARFGYFRSTINPSFLLLRRPTTYQLDIRSAITDQIRIRESNPDLVPSVTDNFDLDIAYYFQDSPGLIRASLFYKKISNNFTDVVSTESENADVRQRVLDYLEPLAATRPDLLTFDDDAVYLLERPENGVGGSIYGFELELIRQLDFLPGFLKDFGVLGNVTYTTSDFPTLLNGVDENRRFKQFLLDLPLEDQAAWVYNLSLNYARGGFDGRVIYTHQTEAVSSYNVHDLNQIVPAYSTLDLRLSYTFDKGGSGWTIFFEGDDLLHGPHDPDIRSGTGSNPDRKDARYFFSDSLQFNGGRTFTMGIKGRF
ncbi:TonB-dependent receptor [Parasphingorhabdus cellanae]|uniref:TonB-dependent receptor n=1 Tax=Parasphingorhabdus cellanae TaxID=2806553 RepID=A0ABX7T7I5_9SPHN|nr:TonB-dependent receptor [Parasphingorhabdus cellanae]QTD57466.1 TonB-dependent receptor [Parasphingorhabdus cellanae]